MGFNSIYINYTIESHISYSYILRGTIQLLRRYYTITTLAQRWTYSYNHISSISILYRFFSHLPIRLHPHAELVPEARAPAHEAHAFLRGRVGGRVGDARGRVAGRRVQGALDVRLRFFHCETVTIGIEVMRCFITNAALSSA